MTITVSTDGSALGNPNGPMGWAWADHHDAESDASSCHRHAGDADAGGATNGTNQIGELCAVLEALRAHPGPEPLVIESDSQYAINCSTKWVRGWKKNGWKNSQKKPVKNADVIKAIDAEISKREGSVTFKWVKGHAGNEGNEKCDRLARTYAGDCRSGAEEGYLPLEGWQSLLASEYSKGTKVPQDARMLLDGAMSPADYRALHAGEPLKEVASGAAESKIEKTEIQESETPSGKPAKKTRATVPQGGSLRELSARNLEKEAETEETESVVAEPAAAEPAAAEPAVREPAAQRPAAQSALRATGLTVDGTVVFSPAPATSATYDGKPRHVRGYIAVDGYVNGDGTLELSGADFVM